MAWMPNRSELDGKLTMDADGTKKVIGRVREAYEYAKTGRSYLVRWELFELDGETPMKEPDGKQREITAYPPTDMKNFRFLQYIDGLLPENAKGGFDFSPKMWEGKKAILTIQYDKKAEAEGRNPRLEIKTVEPYRTGGASSKAALPPVTTPAQPVDQNAPF